MDFLENLGDSFIYTPRINGVFSVSLKLRANLSRT